MYINTFIGQPQALTAMEDIIMKKGIEIWLFFIRILKLFQLVDIFNNQGCIC